MSYHGSSSSSSNTRQQSGSATTQRQAAPAGYHYMPNGSLMRDSEMQGTAQSAANNQGQTSVMQQINVNAPEQVAPSGYHYMPDGTLMRDEDHGKVNGEKKIHSLNLDLSSLSAASETRDFYVKGEDGATFSLEIKNEDNYYYNFITRSFQATKTGLNNIVIVDGFFRGSIIFPTVTDQDRYDIFLFAQPLTTRHADYKEVRFGDGSVDINSTTGSNSLLMTKVIHQFLNLDLTLTSFAAQSTVEIGSLVNDTVSITSGGTTAKQAFSISCSVTTAAKCYRIIKQPTELDIVSFLALSIGSAPVKIPGENEYPTVASSNATVNGAITGGSSAVKVIVDADTSAPRIGDKITAPVATDTVNGNVTSGIKIVMDTAVAAKMSIGDQVTGNAALDSKLVTVAALNPDGDNDSEFSLSTATAIADGVTLTFTPKCNRSLTTAVALNPDGDNALEFSMSQNIGLLDGVALSFSNQMNYRWLITNQAHLIKPGMKIITNTANLTAGTAVANYLDTTTVFAGTEQETVFTNVDLPAIDTLGIKPTITLGIVTTQAGTVIFDKQQKLALAGDALRIGGYGKEEAKRIYGWDVGFTGLNVELTPITTTTTSAVSNSTSVPVASRNGILDDVSTVSGIGIDASVAAPTVDTGAGAVTGAGTLVLTAAQTLESGATLAFAGAGQTATITGFVEVFNAGATAQTLSFDIEKLLSIT